MNPRKGEFGYFTREKKRRLVITLILFAVPLLIFFTGLIHFGKRESLFTIIAVVGCLPACKSLVGLIMAFMQKSISHEEYEKISSKAGDLVMTYEMYITSNQKNGYIDAFAICGNQVVGYSSSDKIDVKFMEDFIQRILHQNGYKVTVKIMKELNPYLDRIQNLAMTRLEREKEIPFTPDERYPELSRSELIKHTILAISL